MIRQARTLLAMLLVCAAGATAVRAQERPSFDCAKADNNIDRAICRNGELAKADREMAAAYAALLARLSGAAKDELVKDQVGWIANRNRACRTDPDNIEDCLKNRYAARIKNLRAYAQGTYPAISEQSLAKQGKLGKITWSYDLTYPRFDGANVDFAAVNARFADAAKKIADEDRPPRQLTAPSASSSGITSRASPSSGRPADRPQPSSCSSTAIAAARTATARPAAPWSTCARARWSPRRACSRRANNGSGS